MEIIEISERYQTLEHLVEKRVLITGSFRKYSAAGETPRSSLITNVHADGTYIDHIWCISKYLTKARLRTAQKVAFYATLTVRKRAPLNIDARARLDIQLEQIELIKPKRCA